MPQSALTLSYTFATQSGNVPASELDSNFTLPITALNTIATYNTLLTDTGIVNAMVAAVPSGLFFTLTAGVEFDITPNFTNTSTSVTANIGSTGAMAIVASGNANVPVGAIQAGVPLKLVYNGANYVIMGGSAATAGGSTTQLQYNNNGAFGGSGMTYNNATGGFSVAAPTSGPAIAINVLDGTNGLTITDTTNTNGFNVAFKDAVFGGRGYIGFGSSTIGSGALTDFGLSSGIGGSVVIARPNAGVPSTTFGPNGNVMISAPSSGTTLALSGTAGTAMQTWSDGTQVASIAPLTASSGYRFGTVTNHATTIYTNDTPRLAISAAGSVTIYEPNFGAAALRNAATYETGSFTATLATGCTTTPTTTWNYTRVGNIVTLIMRQLFGTSNATVLTFSGLPASIQPATQSMWVPVVEVEDNTTIVSDASVLIAAGSGTLIMYRGGASAGFTASGTKGMINPCCITYTLI